VGPDGGEVFLFDAEQVDALAACDLDGGYLELVGHVGDGAQFLRIGHTAPHAGHDGIGAVLLDIGVDALVDEAGLAIVLVFPRPVGNEVVVEGGAAFGAAAGGFPLQLLHDGGNGFETLGD